MAKSRGPLTDAHLETINKLLRACAETEEYCKKCEACGLDVDPERTKNAEQMDIAKRLKAMFFPTSK